MDKNNKLLEDLIKKNNKNSDSEDDEDNMLGVVKNLTNFEKKRKEYKKENNIEYDSSNDEDKKLFLTNINMNFNKEEIPKNFIEEEKKENSLKNKNEISEENDSIENYEAEVKLQNIAQNIEKEEKKNINLIRTVEKQIIEEVKLNRELKNTKEKLINEKIEIKEKLEIKNKNLFTTKKNYEQKVNEWNQKKIKISKLKQEINKYNKAITTQLGDNFMKEGLKENWKGRSEIINNYKEKLEKLTTINLNSNTNITELPQIPIIKTKTQNKRKKYDELAKNLEIKVAEKNKVEKLFKGHASRKKTLSTRIINIKEVYAKEKILINDTHINNNKFIHELKLKVNFEAKQIEKIRKF